MDSGSVQQRRELGPYCQSMDPIDFVSVDLMVLVVLADAVNPLAGLLMVPLASSSVSTSERSRPCAYTITALLSSAVLQCPRRSFHVIASRRLTSAYRSVPVCHAASASHIVSQGLPLIQHPASTPHAVS